MPTPLLTNRQLGPDVARANLLTNGGFEIFQRSGTITVSAGSNNSISADHWQTSVMGGSTTLAASKETSVVGTGSLASLKLVATFDGTNIAFLRHWMKAGEGNQVIGRQFSAAIDVYASVTNAVNIRLASDGTGSQDLRTARNTLANTWQRLTLTITTPSNATYIIFDVEVNVSCTAYVDNATLVVGSQPSNYVPMHPTDELLRCLRYYETLTGNAYQLIAHNFTTTNSQVPWQFKVHKAMTPTVTVQNVTAISLLNPNGGSLIPLTAAAPQSSTLSSADLQTTVASGLVAASASAVLLGSNGLIAAEANP